MAAPLSLVSSIPCVLSSSAIVLATILGLFAGIARLSNNWLLSRIAGTYIEIIRSTPLLVQLFFWYFGVILALPDIDTPQNVAGLAILTDRGIALATVNLSATGAPWQWWLLAALIIGMLVGLLRHRQLNAVVARAAALGVDFLAFALVAVIGYLHDLLHCLPSSQRCL